MPNPEPTPADEFMVAAAPSREGSFATARIVRPFLWLAPTPLGAVRTPIIAVRPVDGEDVSTVDMVPPGGCNVVDLRHLAPETEHEIMHAQAETLLAPKLLLRPGALRACLARGDAAGAVAAIRLALPQDAPSATGGEG